MESRIEREAAELPPLPSRLIAVFFSPGRLMEQLADTPRWAASLLVVVALITLSVALIPADIFMELNRQAALERGAEFPELGERAMFWTRIAIPVGTLISTSVFMFLFTGLYTLIFAFILGDEGTYRQYLAVVSHAWFIAALFGLMVTPLRISTGDPQFTLNLSSFLFFLPDGYIVNVFRFLDLSQIWSTLVIAQGAHAIDRRRSFGSAAMILLSITVAFAMVVAIWA